MEPAPTHQAHAADAEPAPLVILVAHGTRRAGGNQLVRDLAGHVGRALRVPSVATYVELAEPTLADRVVGLPADQGRVVVVPVLLSTGYHVRHDLPAACATAPAGVEVSIGRPLGPDPALSRAGSARLDAAGAGADQPVVLVAAGSSDERADADLERAALLLSDERGVPVRVATMDGRGDRPDEVVRPGDAVSLYLLSPGRFSARAAETAREAGATVVGDVLGPHRAVCDLVVARAAELLRGPAR